MCICICSRSRIEQTVGHTLLYSKPVHSSQALQDGAATSTSISPASLFFCMTSPLILLCVYVFVLGVGSSRQLGTPSCIPTQYTALKHCSMEQLRARLYLLHHFSDLMYSSWRMLNLSPPTNGAQVSECCIYGWWNLC